jgi:hypothetical protein
VQHPAVHRAGGANAASAEPQVENLRHRAVQALTAGLSRHPDRPGAARKKPNHLAHTLDELAALHKEAAQGTRAPRPRLRVMSATGGGRNSAARLPPGVRPGRAASDAAPLALSSRDPAPAALRYGPPPRLSLLHA